MSRHLLIAGFHRSGTSMVTDGLVRAGLNVGDDLIGADDTNPHGHFEDREVVWFHRDVLADNGLTWHVTRPLVPLVLPHRWDQARRMVERRDERHRLWGFKDPRLCLFLGMWKYLLPDARVVVVYRHFADSTWSLERRQAAALHAGVGPRDLHRTLFEDPDRALRMWIVHNRALLRFVDEHPEDTLVIRQDDLFEGLPLVDEVERRWGLGLQPVATSEFADVAVQGNRPGRQPLSRREVGQAAMAVWERLERLRAAGSHAREAQDVG